MDPYFHYGLPRPFNVFEFLYHIYIDVFSFRGRSICRCVQLNLIFIQAFSTSRHLYLYKRLLGIINIHLRINTAVEDSSYIIMIYSSVTRQYPRKHLVSTTTGKAIETPLFFKTTKKVDLVYQSSCQLCLKKIKKYI